MRHGYTLFLFVVLLLVACNGASPEVSEAPSTPVTRPVEGVATSGPLPPTATTVPTQTTIPSATPPPTETLPPPSATPLPPTATPRPTATPEPTATLEPTATATAAPPTVIPARSAPTVAPAAVTADTLRAAIVEAIRQLGDFRWALDPNSRIFYGAQASNEVDCRVIVAGYDRIVALLPAEVPGEPEPVRAARAVAYQGVTRFVNASTPWTSSCREKLASGETMNIIQRAGYRDLMTNLESVDAPWNEALHMLAP